MQLTSFGFNFMHARTASAGCCVPFAPLERASRHRRAMNGEWHVDVNARPMDLP